MRARWRNNLLLTLTLVFSLHLGLTSGGLVCFENDGVVRIEMQNGLGFCNENEEASPETIRSETQLYATGACLPCFDVSLQAFAGQMLQGQTPRVSSPNVTAMAFEPTLVPDGQLYVRSLRLWESRTPSASSYHPRITVLLI